MIKIVDAGGHIIYLNVDLIEKITASPDTLITLLNETKIIVREKPEEIVERIVDFRRRCNDKVDVDFSIREKED